MKWYNVLFLIIIGEVILGLVFLYANRIKQEKRKEVQQIFKDILLKNYTSAKGKSLYEYYEIANHHGSFSKILNADKQTFVLNGKSLKILSGSIHYFRVHPFYWRDRLRKLRAMGANTVETYIPWNLHEPEKDCYDFGEENLYPFSKWLNFVNFIKMAKEEDLFVIIRPGPYICSEWEFGGLPSYLLSIPDIKVRSNDVNYLVRIEKYFNRLLSRLSKLQITYGGPIIMFQLENEYGSFVDEVGNKDHLSFLKNKFEEFGIYGLFVTSDGVLLTGTEGSLLTERVLMTANLQTNVEAELTELEELQPGKPLMVMEYWSGWFDHWGAKHSIIDSQGYAERLNMILRFPASVNLYMFHGGTNFGFMNGANQDTYKDKIVYYPDTTSYDYDALLNENGDYTDKYHITRKLFVTEMISRGLRVPSPPKRNLPIAYGTIKVISELIWPLLTANVKNKDIVRSKRLMPMESLPLKARYCKGDRGGQSYGFVLYRTVVNTTINPEIQIVGKPRDMVSILVDNFRETPEFTHMNQQYQFGFWNAVDKSRILFIKRGFHQLDILVENLGRVNFGSFYEDYDQRKGLLDKSIKLNGDVLNSDWIIMALDFQPEWIKSLKGWTNVHSHQGKPVKQHQPKMFKAYLDIDTELKDTYVNMTGWGKGVVFVNGFNIGRYFSIGPQMALYIPKPLLVLGRNTIIIFELFKYNLQISFSSKQIYQ